MFSPHPLYDSNFKNNNDLTFDQNKVQLPSQQLPKPIDNRLDKWAAF